MPRGGTCGPGRLGAGLRHGGRAVAFSPRVTAQALGRAAFRRLPGGR